MVLTFGISRSRVFSRASVTSLYGGEDHPTRPLFFSVFSFRPDALSRASASENLRFDSFGPFLSGSGVDLSFMGDRYRQSGWSA